MVLCGHVSRINIRKNSTIRQRSGHCRSCGYFTERFDPGRPLSEILGEGAPEGRYSHVIAQRAARPSAIGTAKENTGRPPRDRRAQ